MKKNFKFVHIIRVAALELALLNYLIHTNNIHNENQQDLIADAAEILIELKDLTCKML